MRLRRLVVSGFKTFASRAEIGFDRGITAIVGPNGSGKSNLVDALRWALGETNARELRGQRMDEVIYAGGGKRPRMGVAEVELVIDNDEGRLPVADPEVQVSRRVTRGAADTEYRLNAERVRLRDLEQLLGATGLTQNGYAVVAQNDIDGIIEATPTQRRALVEQAAGVRAHRAACEEAVRRLGHAEEVLRRMEDLLADAEPRLDELAVQAEAALAQRELAERLSQLRGSLAREEWRAARGHVRQARRRLEQATSRWEGAVEADAGFAARAQHERTRLDALREERDAARQELEAARLAAERAAADVRQWHERLRAAVLRRGVAREEIAAAAEDGASASAALARLGRSDSGDAGLDAPRDACARLQAEESRIAQLAEQEEAAVRDAERALAAAIAEQREAEVAVREARLQLELFEGTSASHDAELAAAAAGVESLRQDLAAAEDAAAASEAVAREAEAAFNEAQRSIETAWEAVNAAEERSSEVSAAARAALARAAEAHGRVTGAVGGDGGVARAIARGALSGRRLAECVSAREPRDATAISAALESHAGAWVVPSPTDAANFLDPAGPREEVIDVVVSPMRVAGSWRRAVDAVDVVDEARDAVAALLDGVFLVDGMSEARAALQAGARLAVLPDGRALSHTSLRGGAPARTIEFVHDDREAARELAAAKATEAAAIAEVAAAREQLSAAEAAATAAAAAAQAAQREQAIATATLRALRSEAEAARGRLAAIESARQARAGQGEAAARSGEEAVSRLRQTSTAAEAARAGLTAAQEALQQRHGELAGARDAARAGELELARAEGAVAEAEHREAELRRAIAVAESRRKTGVQRMADAETDALGALVLGRRARRSQEEASEAVEAARARSAQVGPELDEMERVLVALEAEHAEVAVSLARADDERAAAQAELAEAEAEVARLVEVAREEGDDDGAEWDPAAAERTEREIVRLERRIASLGPVNALAPEQHEALEGRVRALHDQHADIDAACRDIHSMARRLAAELERRFDAVFDAVSAQFQTLFSELFPGGKATLRLEESVVGAEEELAEDVAERRPGVEILAQPPGKRLGPLRLLSGGERALTALAVVLALQQVNPSPFYVFDEVDAALDDSNVLRFTRLLRRLAETQQFIVVTHNHITMAAADVLWGITIDSDGVSSVIGVRFDERMDAQTVVTGLQRIPSRAVR